MAPGRKRRVPRREEEEEEEEEENQPGFRWEWEGDDGTWSVYSDGHNQEITSAFRSGSLSVPLALSPTISLHVDLKKMVQRNQQTGFERRVRCAVKDGEDYYVWQWEDDDSQWQGYAAGSCRELERVRSGGEGEAVRMAVGRTRYTLDPARMVQLNLRTKHERRIGRMVSDAVPSTAPSIPSTAPSIPSTATSPGTPAPSEGAAPAKRARGGSGGKGEGGRASASTPDPDGGGDDTGTVKTLVVQGKAALDTECREKQGKAHVYCEGDDVYDALLNQTNLQFNNNKFYIIQLLEDNEARRYSVWLRWGRVGKVGQNNLIPCGPDLQKAKDIFEKKFADKTKNEWADREHFEKVAGKYDMLTLDYSGDSTVKQEEGAGREAGAAEVQSTLDQRLQELVALICDIRAMEETMLQMKYDTKKAPLGKLTADQIRAGYSSLRKIEDCLKGNVLGRPLLEACNEFYTRIPHDFGLKTPPVIRSRKELQEKISLLEALSEIEVAISVVRSELAGGENPLDRQYRALHCSLQPLDHRSTHFQIINKYLQSTHAPTHNDYKMKLLEVFNVAREGEEEEFRTDLTNRQLLWHGSRLTNWVGILKQGLRIAPPEAPVTGYMFGKGIYFADMSSKSANYCFATREHDVGLLMLCEVALGESNELLVADSDAARLPAGKHSTKGLGRIAPAAGNSASLDGVGVPLGPGQETGVQNPQGYTLNYNEYVVYHPAQVRMKYLLKVHFNFTSLW